MKFIGICTASIASVVAFLSIMAHDAMGSFTPLSSTRKRGQKLQSSSSSAHHMSTNYVGQQWQVQQHPFQGYQPEAPQPLQQVNTFAQQYNRQDTLNDEAGYGQIYSSQYEKPVAAVSAVSPGKWNADTCQSGEPMQQVFSAQYEEPVSAQSAVRPGKWNVDTCQGGEPMQQVLSAQYEEPVAAQSAVRPGKWNGQIYHQQSISTQYENTVVAPSLDESDKWNRPTGPFLQSDQGTSIPAVENYYERQRNGYVGSYYNGGHS